MEYKQVPQNYSVCHELFPFWMIKYTLDYKKIPPTPNNIFEIPQKLLLDTQLTELKLLWAIECNKNTPSLYSSIKQIFKKEFLYAIILNSLSNFFNACTLISIYFIYHYLIYDYSIFEGMLITIITSLCMIISTLLRRASFIKLNYLKIKLANVLISLIQEKILEIDLYFTTNSEETSKIINSLSTDLEIIALLDATLDFIGIVPKIIICICIIYVIIGPIGLIGLGISLIHIPIVLIVSFFMVRHKQNSEIFTQSRIKKFKKFIEGIQVLKMLAWEKPFVKKINEERYKEMSYLKRFDMIRSVLQWIALAGICLSIFVTILVNRYSGKSLNLGEVLLIIGCLYSFQVFLPYMSILGISAIIMVKQAITKVEKVLLLKECRTRKDDDTEFINESNNFNLLRDQTQKNDFLSTTYYAHNRSLSNLDKVNFKIQTGELLIIIGKAGSGKSRLLLSLLGEIEHENLNIFQRENIAYYSENPWIMNSSIKENIIMGREFNQELYESVLKCCCLKDDLNSMPNNDDNIVSDRGTTLSGGQKSRIALARVLYSQFDIYLLDDPFSSLDSKVLAKLFKRTILKMLSNKTRVVVMRNYDYLHYADRILVLDDNEFHLYESFKEFQQDYTHDNFTAFDIKRTVSDSNNCLANSQLLIYDSKTEIHKESLKLSICYQYLMLGFKSKIILITISIISVGSVCSLIWFYYCTANYSNSSLNREANVHYLEILSLAYILMFLSLVPLTFYVNNSNLKLHQNAVEAVSKLPSSYFDENSLGVVLNKFTKEISTIDYILMPMIQGFSITFFPVFTSLIILMIIQPFTIISIFMFCFEIFILVKYVLPVCNSIKRLEIILSAPIIYLASSVLTGLTTIRHLHLQDYLTILMQNATADLYRINFNSELFGSFMMISGEYGISLLYIINIIIIIASRGYFNTELSLIIASTLIGLHSGTSTLFDIIVKFDNSMMPTQNLFSLINLPKEKNEKKKKLQKIYGKIEFLNLSVKYEDKIVLNNFSCIIESGSKVAIIGRTGAGKSTIFKIILRLVNPSNGTILLDDSDYMDYSITSIRKLIAVNPQNSLIFNGSINQNLDPFKKYSNKRIISVLKSLKLNRILCNDLDDNNFGKTIDLSIGEKQLFSLARTLLKSSKIVLLDEPVSTIDKMPGELMQDLIKEGFKNSTVLTISHKEDTFKDYDYFLLIDNGILKEFSPIRNVI